MDNNFQIELLIAKIEQQAVAIKNLQSIVARQAKRIVSLEEELAVYKNKKIQTIDGKAGFLFNNISRRSRDKGREIEFDREYIKELYNKQNGRCFYTDEPMSLGYHRDKKDLYSLNFHNISVDRIDSKKGYTKENTVLCCWGCNALKGDHSVQTLYDMLALFFNSAITSGKIK